MIGFASEVVNVEEDGGNAVLRVLLAVSLQRNVTVTFATSSGTAKGKKIQIMGRFPCYCKLPVLHSHNPHCPIHFCMLIQISVIIFNIRKNDIHTWSDFP